MKKSPQNYHEKIGIHEFEMTFLLTLTLTLLNKFAYKNVILLVSFNKKKKLYYV